MKRKQGKLISVLLTLALAVNVVLAIPTEVTAADSSRISHVTVHDPSVVRDGNTYYVFGSHMAWAKSTDLLNWQTFKTNINTEYATLLANAAKWSERGGPTENSTKYELGGNLWAPDVIWNKDMRKWCMYMSVNGLGWYSSIVLLTADNIEGPYKYAGSVVYSGFINAADAAETDFAKVMGTNEVPARYLRNINGVHTYGTNAIDPCVTYDDDGSLWMTYGSWFGGIYMLKLDSNTGLRDYTYTYQTVENVSDEYQGLKIAGGHHVSGEGSYLEKIGDYWYLFISYGGLAARGGYNIRVFRSKDIKGPYADMTGDPAIYTSASNNVNGKVGNRLMSYYKWSYMSSGQVAQGHNSAFVDSDGRAYVVYHTRFNNRGETHEVRVHQLFTNQDGWLVAAPFEYAGEKLSAIDKADVSGSYEVLFHKGTSYANLVCVEGQTVNFNKDGTLSGSVTGTWALDGYYATLSVGGVTYKGVFVEQKMEGQNKSTLCFTAIGSDEVSVWGYRYDTPDEEIADSTSEPSATTTTTTTAATIITTTTAAITTTASTTTEPAAAAETVTTTEPAAATEPAATAETETTTEPETTTETSASSTTSDEPISTAGSETPSGVGSVEQNVKVDKNAPEIEIPMEIEHLKDSVLSDEEKKAAAEGADVEIVMSVSVPEAVEPQVEAAIKEAVTGSGYIVGKYLELNLNVYINDVLSRGVTVTEEPVTVTVEVPIELRANGRKFVMIREHDGEADILNDIDQEPNTISFETDRFSIYVITYADDEGVSSDNGVFYLAVVLITVVVLAAAVPGVLYIIRHRKRNGS